MVVCFQMNLTPIFRHQAQPNMTLKRFKVTPSPLGHLLVACSLLAFAAARASDPKDFGAYYTTLNTGQSWEKYSRVGPHADIIARVPGANGELVFWRGTSYLPYWKTDKGQWNLMEIVRRGGDGEPSMPDRVNTYSNVKIIESSPQILIVQWRYLSNFTAGNPHGEVNSNHFIEETFQIAADGRIKRIVKAGTEKIDEWKDPLNQTTQELQLGADGIVEISRTEPGHAVTSVRVAGAGNPVKQSVVADPSLWFKFDEGCGDLVTEETTSFKAVVSGHKTLWKRGISGTALEFDGYHTLAAVPAAKSPRIAGGGLTLEAWFALGAYPWNWAPIIQQGDNDGYFLGVDSHGYPGFKVKVDGKWEQLSVPNSPPYVDANHLALFKWYQIAGSYEMKDGMMRLFVNGKEIASKKVGKGGVQAADADVRVGKAAILVEPTEGVNTNLPSEYGMDGLLDEVKVYNKALNAAQVSKSFDDLNPGSSIVNAPDMQRRSLPNPSTNGEFKARYESLPYYETWDNMSRFGKYSDVVVGFDLSPAKFLFWKGLSYVDVMANGENQWLSQEFAETGFTDDAPGDNEPMSDKGCWDSHVRIIESNPARIVVHWRYRLTEPGHHWANYNPSNGWGDITDQYYYIYPDGVAAKSQRCYTAYPDSWHEWNEQIVVLGEGQHPESVVKKSPVMTLVNQNGKAVSYDWNPDPPNPNYWKTYIQMIHFTGKYSPFAIQFIEGGDVYAGERTWYSVFPSWNHWPTAQVNSSGRNSSFTDRAAHCSISHLIWEPYLKERGDKPFVEKLLLQGMTDQPAASLMGLAKSWISAPQVTDVSGGVSHGYEKSHRAYVFTIDNKSLAFQIAATKKQTIHNVCIELRNWQNKHDKAAVKINGTLRSRGPDFRQGTIIDTDGTCTMLVWLVLSADTPRDFVITKELARP